MKHMKTRRFITLLLVCFITFFDAQAVSRLYAQSGGSFRALGIEASNENATVRIAGTYHDNQANHIRLEMKNLSDSLMLISLDVRRETTLWYGGTQTQFCLLLDKGVKKTADIPFPMDYWKFHSDSETALTLMVSAVDEDNFALSVLNAYESYIPSWNFCFREPNMQPGERIIGRWFETKDLFDQLWDPEQHFHLYHTPNFDIYAHKRSIANKHIEEIKNRRDLAFITIKELLDVDFSGRVRLVFYPDAETKTKDTNHTGMGYAFLNNVVEIYNEDEKLDDFHEIAHVVVGLIGSPPAIFNEGFAVYISEKLGAESLESFGYGDKTIDEVSRDLLVQDRLLPIEEILSFTEIGSKASQWAVSYPQAASFTGFIIQSHGYDAFKQLLSELQNSGDPDVVRQNKKRFKDITGLSIQEQEKRWLDTLNH